MGPQTGTDRLLHRLPVTWAALVGATVLSYLVGTTHGVSSARASAAIVVGVGFGKAWLVIRSFMETSQIDRGLRIAFDIWTLVTGTGLVVVLAVSG